MNVNVIYSSCLYQVAVVIVLQHKVSGRIREQYDKDIEYVILNKSIPYIDLNFT